MCVPPPGINDPNYSGLTLEDVRTLIAQATVNQPKGAITAYIVLMSLGTVTMYVYYSTVYTAIQDVIEPRLRGFAVALYFCCMYVFGASLTVVSSSGSSDTWPVPSPLPTSG